MPRCIKRRVCKEPLYKEFVPLGHEKESEVVVISVDEYEAIRLIDKEGLSQEQCADMMGIRRTTAQLIYNSAKKKLIDCIVEGRGFKIKGGNYFLCDGSAYCIGCCKSNSLKADKRNRKGVNIMRIAVTYKNGEIFQHFGHTEQFKIYDVENGKILNEEIIDTNGQGHGALGGFLFSSKVEVLICGSIGMGAHNALTQAGIKFYGGVSGSADDAVKAFLAGNLGYNPNIKCSHHGEGHSCGSHKCGENKNGCSGN